MEAGVGSAEQAAVVAFYLKPSVASWLRPRYYTPHSEARRAEAAKAVQVPFYLKPSVASWLARRLPREEPSSPSKDVPVVALKTVEEPWAADFEVVAELGSVDAKLADAAPACATPSTALPTPSTGQDPPSPLAAFKVAPPPSPASLAPASPMQPREADALDKDHAGEVCRMRTAMVLGEGADEKEKAKPEAFKPEAEAPAKVDKSQEAEPGDREIPMSHMRSAIPSSVQMSAQKQVDLQKQPKAAARPKMPDDDDEEEQGMQEEVVPPGAGQHGVPLSRAGGPPPAARAPARLPASGPPPPAPAAAAVSPPEPSSMKELDDLVACSLDGFFGDEQNWKKVGREIATSTKAPPMNHRLSAGLVRFRIQVPKPYPGVQYRRSKCLDDRYPRFAENGSTVQGRVEDNGEWLKVGEAIYLPMRVGAVHIMDPLPNENGEVPPAAAQQPSATESFWNWLACCSGERSSASADSEVVINSDEGASQHTAQPRAGSSPARPPSAGTAGAPAAFGAAGVRGPPMGGGAAARTGPGGRGRPSEEDTDFQGPKRLPEDVSRNPLSNLDAANRHFSSPINPFSDTAATGPVSPSKRRPEARVQNEIMQSTLADPAGSVFQA